MGRSESPGEIQTCRHSLLANHRQSIISILDGISATHSGHLDAFQALYVWPDVAHDGGQELELPVGGCVRENDLRVLESTGSSNGRQYTNNGNDHQ